MSMTSADQIGTYDDLVAAHGDPQEGGTPQAAAAARHLASLHQERMDSIIGSVEVRGDGSLNASEQRSFDAHRGQASLLQRTAELYDERGRREGLSHVQSGNVGARSRNDSRYHTSGGTTYRKGDHGTSWVRDMVAVATRNDTDAIDRLQRNAREVSGMVQTRALSTTDGAGGYMVPPAWLVDQAVDLARPARPTADLVSNQTLPTGTDSLNIPRILTGTAVAEQATQNTPVQNTDATDNAVTAAVATLAGQQVVAVQLIEQSPISVDNMLLGDLAADYAAKVDLFVLNNTGTNKKGLLQEAGTIAVTYTDATPTVGELYSKLADAVQQIITQRYASATAIVMHPRRWAWFLAAADTAGRPLVVPDAQGSFNAVGTTAGAMSASGRVGSLLGLPVYVDPQIPINLGAGTNEDRIIVMKADDPILWEGAPHAEAFRDPLAAQLSVILRFYRYVAFSAARQPKSVAIIAGSGLITPAF